LPRAGIEGTVAVRDLDARGKGRVFAKDGYIEGASAIAGYVLTAHHGPVIFVFLVNDWQHGLDAVWSKEDQMLDLIAAS
jgi:D-alanyl-D-alanine carboxypeptidase/D-alanyl-D-alanine-endopeptidase (penicillin-binding protein 4)